uniref:39S ribosomal protein L12, mitochondrial n=1 Tax=Aceria tosichella TaxID=561515 RepID=A0A6G1SE30_9ACAR
MSAGRIKAIVDQISQLKFFEVTLLNEALKKELKIPDVQRVVASGATQAAGQTEDEGVAKAGVKSSFTLKLTKFDETKKVALIKEIKKLVEGINLVEAKRFVEECPKIIKSNLTKEEAEALQKQLEGAGGVVKLE